MLRSFSPVVCEAKKSLPNNHGALLRFRTDKVGTACAIPFKKVLVHKAIKWNGKLITEPNLFLSNLYSQKVTGSILNRSINNLDQVERYIAPVDLINKMASNCTVEYDSRLTMSGLDYTRDWEPDRPIVSTVPMPVMMKMIGWKDVPDFPYQKIWTQKATIESPDCDVYQTIYYPDNLVGHYRTSVIGNVVISEFIRKPEVNPGQHLMVSLREDFGIQAKVLDKIKESSQTYGKIMPIDETIRQRFILELTNKYGIYSVGRFATWRQLLLDDVVKDLQHIERFIRDSNQYSRMMHSKKGK